MMPLFGGFSIGRWFGFPIRIDFSWFFLVALIVWIFSSFEFPRQLPGYSDLAYLTMGVAAAIFFFLSLLLHELAHSVVARSRGIPVQGITLFIFGGVAQTTMEAERPVDEFLLTVVGPLASFALAGGFWLLGSAASGIDPVAPAGQVALYLAYLNFVLAVFNLVPGFPLDGGRLFRAAVWQVTGDLDRATRWASASGRAFGYALIVLGGLVILNRGAPLIWGLWSAFIGWFLASAASSSYRQFLLMRAISGVPVARVLRPTPAVPAGLSALELSSLYVAGAPSILPVVRDGQLLGVVTLDDVAAVPPEERARKLAAELMTDVTDTPRVRPDETLDRVVAKLHSQDAERVLVGDGDRVLGVVSLQEIGDWVQRARRLGLDRPGRGLEALGGGARPDAGEGLAAASEATTDAESERRVSGG